MLPSKRDRESVFGPRRARRHSVRSFAGLAALLLGLACGAWLLKDVAAFYAALFDGRRAIERHEFAKARAAFERAWRVRPEHPLILDGAGLLFIHEQATGWKTKARESYQRAVQRGLKRDPFINHVREARKFLDAGRYEEAEVELDRVLLLSPLHPLANLQLGHLWYSQGRIGKAIEQYQKALTLAPRSTEAQSALTRAQEAKARGSIPYILDRHGAVLAAQDAVSGLPIYPCDFWTAHVIGYRTTDHGRAGLEEALGDRLRGNTVTLALDARLQRIADTALGWQKGAVVILKPQTGEILAAVSHPTFRPGQLEKTWFRVQENPNDPLRNRALEGLYEPGSIAKIIAAAAIIESRTDVSRLYPFKCRGVLMIGEEPFWDWQSHRNVDTFADAFNQSCNVAYAKMAPLIGAATLSQFLSGFGFGEQDHIRLELPVGQSRAPLEPDTPYKLASTFIGLGAGFRITPLHAAMLAAAVANGGVMMAPALVKEIRSVTGEVMAAPAPRIYKIAMKKETAAALTNHMMDFVQSGIGRKARMLRYHVAGKTGTSGSSKKGLHGWFICFAPAEKPELAMAILCENGGSGHSVAAPIAQRILNEALK